MTIDTTYDEHADALYIRFRQTPGRVVSQMLSDPIAEYIPLDLEDIVFDFDEAGKLVGIEVLSASQYFEAAFLAQAGRPGVTLYPFSISEVKVLSL